MSTPATDQDVAEIRAVLKRDGAGYYMTADKLCSIADRIEADAEKINDGAFAVAELGRQVNKLKADLAQARNEALEEAAHRVEPSNPPSDWTEYARNRAECGAIIRALKSNLPARDEGVENV